MKIFKNKEFIIISIFILLLLCIGIFISILLLHKTYSIYIDDNTHLRFSLKTYREKSISIELENDGDLIFHNFNNLHNPNYILFFIKDSNDKVLKKGILHNNGDDSIISSVRKGKYTLSFLYMGKNKISLSGDISIKKHTNLEYAILDTGSNIRDKIAILAGDESEYYLPNNTSIKKIKLAKKMNQIYETDEYLVSSISSHYPIYMWMEDDTLYFYSSKPIQYNESSSGMFKNMKSLVDVKDLKYFDSSRVDSFSSFFLEDSLLTDIQFLSYYDTSSVTSFKSMFEKCSSLQDIVPIFTFQTDHLVDIGYMFQATSVHNLFVLKYFDVSHVNYAYGLFEGSKISDLTPIKDWKFGNIDTMFSMFSYTKIKNVDALKDWDVSNINSMNGIFQSCYDLNDISGLSNWNTKSLKSLSDAFQQTSITDLDALKKWDMSKVEDLSSTFKDCRKISDFSGIKDWDVSHVTKMEGLFSYTFIKDTNFLSKWDTRNVTTLKETFSHTKLKSLDGLKNWDTSKVENFNCTFCITNLEDSDAVKEINDWNLSSGTNFDSIFEHTKVRPSWNGTWTDQGTFVKS